MHFFYPPELPISLVKDELLELIVHNQVVVVAGDTGSGKTTQLPKICLEALPDIDGMVGCTQPRRVAATSVAQRVKEELGPNSHLVGSKIRFSDQTDQQTKIKFMTDGVLLAETRKDPLLNSYDVLIVDEAHERSLNIDFLLGYVKRLIQKRNDIRIVITSATIDTELFSAHFDNAPIFTIEGRNFPVEILYRGQEEEKDVSFLEHAVEMVNEIASGWPPGDILLFMPTEKDIRTAVEVLQGRLATHTILPLFGRLQAADQLKVFKQRGGLKVVVATNVAETSVTVPGITYVVDTGLARISSYNPRSRTTGLPVTRISQASCNQRAGRCGRIGPGTCFRLYSEDDYSDRPLYTTPEIKRSNLAEVLLQMIALDLGNPADFPFLEPPLPSAVREGFRILEELGAITRRKKLTADGRLMARLPIDPVISRIIIEASRRSCLREVTVIASALAIQDPKIRPAEQESKADEAHKQFSHPHSDFMALLCLWDDFHKDQERFSWSHLKRYSREQFLSFQRMREWIDLHDQLHRILKRFKTFTINDQAGSYEQIHRSLLRGFFRQSAQRKKGNVYHTDGMREIMIFPGSHQFAKSGEWILSASYIETSRLYALSVATIEPEWIEHAAGPFCSYRWTNIRWQKKSGRVVADETVSLRGLTLLSGRVVNYPKRDKKNRAEARSVFIRDALVENKLGKRYPFLIHNQTLLKKWQGAEHKLRKKDIVVHDEDIYAFYESVLPEDVYDRSSLVTYLKRSEASTLFMPEEFILLRQPDESELLNYPSELSIGHYSFRLTYDFSPGQPADGVTAHIPISEIHNLHPESFEWLVPGLLKEKTVFLIKALPKKIRKHLIPVNQNVDRILDKMNRNGGNYFRELSAVISLLFNISVQKNDWPQSHTVPSHLQMRFCLIDEEGKQCDAGRDLLLLQAKWKTSEVRSKRSELRPADKAFLKTIEGAIHTCWNFDSVPSRIPLYSETKGLSGYLYGYLEPLPESQGVTLRYTNVLDEAIAIGIAGSHFLLQLAFKDQHKVLKKYCKTALSGPSTQWLVTHYGGKAEMLKQLIRFLQTVLFGSHFDPLITKEQFQATLTKVRENGYYQSGRILIEDILSVLRNRQQTKELIDRFNRLSQNHGSPDAELYAVLYESLDKIIPADFLERFDSNQLHGCNRYLKSLRIRIERAYAHPAKDRKKRELIRSHQQNERRMSEKMELLDEEGLEMLSYYSYLISEYHIALFSPEIKTMTPVSEKKLKLAWRKLSSEI